jgi:methionine biosynthesis protein MetW
MTAQLELVHVAPPATPAEPRADHFVVGQLIEPGARILDIGCGDGALMRLLAREKQARCSGLERDPAKVRACVAAGLSVTQGDAVRDLSAFPNGGFDAVILSQSLQKMPDPRAVLKEAARIGKRVIVSIHNAGHWRARTKLLLEGRTARWSELNRACTVRDFAELSRALLLNIETAVPITRGRIGAPFAKTLWRANWFAEEAVFLLAD